MIYLSYEPLPLEPELSTGCSRSTSACANIQICLITVQRISCSDTLLSIFVDKLSDLFHETIVLSLVYFYTLFSQGA